MTESKPKFSREAPEQRRRALIEATLDLVAQDGLRGATVRQIAERAQVTQGLIRHYFPSKEDLILAAYEHHMTWMTDITYAPVAGHEGPARDRLAAFVRAALSAPVVDPRSIAIWSAFLNSVVTDAAMRAMHERTYAGFRDKLETLIGDTLREAGRPAHPAGLRRLGIACNAVIDGLWMEGAVLAEEFAPSELEAIGTDSVGAIIGIDLDN